MTRHGWFQTLENGVPAVPFNAAGRWFIGNGKLYFGLISGSAPMGSVGFRIPSCDAFIGVLFDSEHIQQEPISYSAAREKTVRVCRHGTRTVQ